MATTETLRNDYVFTGDVRFTGTGVVPDNSVTNSSISSTAAIERSKLAQDVLRSYPVDLTTLRIWDAIDTLITEPLNDDLGLNNAVFGTDPPIVITLDSKTISVTQRARCVVKVPHEYDTGATINIRINAGMQTTVADTSATLDVEAYRIAGDGTLGSDHVLTAAQSINSLTADDYDFNLEASGVAPGDLFDVRITVAIVDAATVTSVTGAINAIIPRFDVKG